MIQPKVRDLYRSVVRHRAGFIDRTGLIESFDERFVFVLFNGDQTALASLREDLDWCHPGPGSNELDARE